MAVSLELRVVELVGGDKAEPERSFKLYTIIWFIRGCDVMIKTSSQFLWMDTSRQVNKHHP